MEEMNFGLRVEKLMKEREVKPTEFYNAIGIVPQLFYDWKKKSTAPTTKTALRVASFFNVTVEYLLTGNTDNPLQKRVDELEGKLKQIQAILNS